ncbi:MAG: Gldg family protein [Candidatus Latescibacterota bacterium]|nr:MAG: Gldg family protein [Candidatus Latescibacterota bacterium]
MTGNKINFTVVKALCKRDLRLYFSNPTGYVFITLFIFLSAAAAFWQERFFLNNLANLDQLNVMFPFLLMFFVPAITMGVWADERKQGTDELLLTLPATDLEIVIGKYLSTLGIYTAALLLSLSHLIVLFWLGNPDLGLMVANYAGYWLIGATFISIGMLASLLSPNMTIAFILGAVLCSLFVHLGSILGVLGRSAENLASPLTVFEYFGDFARGVVSLSGLVYFVSTTATLLYLNVVFLSRRSWPQEADGYKMWIHHTARAVAVVVAVVAFNVLVGRMSLRVDLTAGRLHSLSKETRNLVKEIPNDRRVFVQAYLSKDVPNPFFQTRANLYGFLRVIDSVAGEKVQVIIQDTEPFSEEAREARETFGIVPVEVPVVGGRVQTSQLFMGVAFTCGAEEDVIPFFDRGLPTEYELARSIRVVARTQRKKIGVINTQVKLFGGFDFNTFQSQPSWPVVEELKKQYEVVQISAKEAITDELDGLLVALPSSLSQAEMDNLRAYIEAGNPSLLVVDPLPIIDIALSPSEESGANVNPFMRNKGPQPEPKGDINGLLRELGVQWNTQQIIWDAYNPHPELANLPPEVVFVGAGNKNPNSFNPSYEVTQGLQELVLLFPGTIEKAPGSPYSFETLVKSGMVSGAARYDQLVQRSFFGVQLVTRGLQHFPTRNDYTLAAHVVGGAAPADSAETPKNVNVIVIGDLDFVSNQFFEIRKRGIEGLNFDNVSFFLNCIDLLVGDDSFIALRKRRVKHRTLETVESRTREYVERRAQEEQEAEAEAQRALAEAQRRLDEKVTYVRQRTDLDSQTKQIMARNLQEVESRRFEAMKTNITAKKDAKIQRSKENMESQIRAIQSNIKMLAGLVPPIPVFLVGILVFVRRRKREKEGAAAARRLRG